MTQTLRDGGTNWILNITENVVLFSAKEENGFIMRVLDWHQKQDSKGCGTVRLAENSRGFGREIVLRILLTQKPGLTSKTFLCSKAGS